MRLKLGAVLIILIVSLTCGFSYAGLVQIGKIRQLLAWPETKCGNDTILVFTAKLVDNQTVTCFRNQDRAYLLEDRYRLHQLLKLYYDRTNLYLSRGIIAAMVVGLFML